MRLRNKRRVRYKWFFLANVGLIVHGILMIVEVALSFHGCDSLTTLLGE